MGTSLGELCRSSVNINPTNPECLLPSWSSQVLDSQTGRSSHAHGANTGQRAGLTHMGAVMIRIGMNRIWRRV